MSDSKNQSDVRQISVDALARVEGEGALRLTMRDGKVENVQFNIYEPPRFYEAFLRGRDYTEVPDITARICGICPVAYQMSSCHALEKAMGVFDLVGPEIRELRNLLYCGEWIESHALHIFMLHLPDFLGYESAISMAADHGPTVQKALRIKKLGNAILEAVAGRAVHPVGVCVGGFYGGLSEDKAASLLPETRDCLDEMCDLTLFMAKNLDYPDLERDYEFLSVFPEDEYPMNLGKLKSNKGLFIEQEELLDAIEERHVSHSTSLHAVVMGRGAYMVGPLARFNLCHDKLHPRAAELVPKVCDAIGKQPPWQNNFYSLLARAIETVHALARAADMLDRYKRPKQSRVEITPRAGVGAHGTEAPRGLCWHQYRTNADGKIESARIIPPTSQNQLVVEQDLRDLADKQADLSDEDLTFRCEHLIRNYDPCISCSCHFLKLEREWLD